MKRYEILLLISTMMTRGKSVRVEFDSHVFRLERQDNYDIWHDETTYNAAMIVYEFSHIVLDEWLNDGCEEMQLYPHRYSFYN